jgi:integrase
MALKQAVVWGLVPRNAAALVDGIADKPTERRPFTPDEQRRILDAARGDRLYVMVVLAHATGLRQSELLGVRWADVDFDTRVLRFTTQYGRDGILREPKTTAGLRVLSPSPPSTSWSPTAANRSWSAPPRPRGRTGTWSSPPAPAGPSTTPTRDGHGTAFSAARAWSIVGSTTCATPTSRCSKWACTSASPSSSPATPTHA